MKTLKLLAAAIVLSMPALATAGKISDLASQAEDLIESFGILFDLDAELLDRAAALPT